MMKALPMRMTLAVIACLAATAIPAMAQPAAKQPGDSAVAAVLRRAGVAPSEGALAGTDAKARAQALDALERSYTLPRALLDREDTPPPNASAVMDSLGLVRRDGAPTTDLRGRTPSTQEIVDALAPR